jgi:ABC-2 type transport system permease protein
MQTIWLVIKHDVASILRQRTFWIMTLLMPALLMGTNAYIAAQDNAPAPTAPPTDTQPSIPTVGLVDLSQSIAHIPPDLPPHLFLPFAGEAAAQVALDQGNISQYVLIPADFASGGEIVIYDRGFQLLGAGDSSSVAFNGDYDWALLSLINANLTGDAQLATVLQNPTPRAVTQMHQLQPPAPTANNQAMAIIVARVMPYLFYFLLIMGGSYMMRSVVAEKENRTVEVLLLSLEPTQLMIGKIIAMSVIVLIQLVAWLGGGMLILDRAAALSQFAAFVFPPGFFLWAILFLLLGYLLFAAIMAAVGALATNAREGGQAIWILVIPLMPTLMFGQLFVEEPDNLLVIGLSLFPFSSPSAMVTRLAVGAVPVWQLLVSVLGLAATTYLFIVLAGRFFKSGNLLSDDSFSWRRMAHTLSQK